MAFYGDLAYGPFTNWCRISSIKKLVNQSPRPRAPLVVAAVHPTSQRDDIHPAVHSTSSSPIKKRVFVEKHPMAYGLSGMEKSGKYQGKSSGKCRKK